MVEAIGYNRLQTITSIMPSNMIDRGETGISFALLMLQNTNNLGQLFKIQLLWTWSQLVSGSGVSLAHTYQLGLFPKQYCTMLPRGLQQNETLISHNVIVISYSSEKQHGYWGLSLEMSNEEQFKTRWLSRYLHSILSNKYPNMLWLVWCRGIGRFYTSLNRAVSDTSSNHPRRCLLLSL